ncbi:hypothetical protein ABZV14_05885 [Streptosporangium canum]|uniref:hypothetical protein n=1 Tax=Streptosporangium canum TaxID=324952 RepID=UPI0033B2E7C1
MQSYEVLNSLPPAAFTYPEMFVTSFDVPGDECAVKQYKRGLEIATEYDKVAITRGGVWSAYKGLRVGIRSSMWMSSCISYEGIGYHRSTSELLRGFIDGPAALYVERYTDSGWAETLIKEGARRCTGGCCGNAISWQPVSGGPWIVRDEATGQETSYSADAELISGELQYHIWPW